ncbi:protein of unknown function [Pseudomonas mediterranea]
MGASLLAMAAGQSAGIWLYRRHREQARSHNLEEQIAKLHDSLSESTMSIILRGPRG